MPIDRSDFADACVSMGLLFGVNPHYLMAVAELRTAIGDGATGGGTGPYAVTQSAFDADSVATDLDLVLDPGDIAQWASQVTFAANAARRHQNELIGSTGGMPSAIQLYAAQWPGDGPDVAALDAALKATAKDVGDALAREFDDGAPTDATLAGATAAAAVPAFDPARPAPDVARGVFRGKAPWVMRRLLDDFPALGEVGAAAILGNIGHECAGFRSLQEIRPAGGGAGGFGWCQWTGVRRTAFLSACAAQGLAPTSDVANYAYLKSELSGHYAKVVAALGRGLSLADAVRTFDDLFEVAGARHDDRRLEWAREALDAYHASQASPGRALPAPVRLLLDPDGDFAPVAHAAAAGTDYWLVDEFSDAGGQVLVRQSGHAPPEVVARDSALFPLQPATASLPAVAAIPAAVKAALAAGSAGDRPPDPLTGGGHAAAAVLAAARRCDETLITRFVPGTNDGRRACAWAVNRVVESALGRPVGGGLSTVGMVDALARTHRQVGEAAFVGGAIIISSTDGRRVGHVGILGDPSPVRDDTPIYSNSSSRGVFSHVFTLGRWKAYYRGRLGLPVAIYQL